MNTEYGFNFIDLSVGDHVENICILATETILKNKFYLKPQEKSFRFEIKVLLKSSINFNS